MIHNAHVVKYKRWLLWIAEQHQSFIRQIACYTELMLEIDKNWKPEHLR